VVERVGVARFRAMGTDVEVLVLVDADAAVDVDVAAKRAGELAAGAVERLEARWSRFRPESELTRVNTAGGAPVVVSSDTFALVARAVDAWRSTGGRYDPSVLAALEAAGYDRSFDALVREADADADADADAAPVAAPGCAGVVLDPQVRSVRLPAGVTIDLGGIGKGYAADLVSDELLAEPGARWRGVVVNLGGDLRARGAAPALRHATRAIARVTAAMNCARASGSFASCGP